MTLIRSRITSGEYPVDQPIPSTAELRRQTGLSLTVVRRAVQQLQADGILQGHPGKGVYVKALPADADSERGDLKTLSEQLRALKANLDHLAEQSDPSQSKAIIELRVDVDRLEEAVGRLAENVGRIDAYLIDLATQNGDEYPQGGAHDVPRAATSRGQRRR